MLDTLFNRQAPNILSEAEQALKSWGINYEKQPDGTLVVKGNLDIFGRGLTRLPDLSSVSVGGSFICDHNQLTSLEHAPVTVGGSFICNNNRLTSLEHAPAIGGDFYCYNNQLTSLEHAPAAVGGSFLCSGNQLTSLEHAPKTFKELKSDFGTFSSWNPVPEELRTSPETKARLGQEKRAQKETAIRNAIILQAPMAVKATLRLRKPRLS